ncbi:hypothetical protein AHAS_Ahas02G0082500 [Arachis hypogaea]
MCKSRLVFTSDKKPLAMVLTPTRELSIQVEEHAKLLGKGLPFKTALVVGGEAMARQLYRFQQGVELIVGTPGRLVDLLTKHEIDLDNVMTFVLDEVDCMLQRGFRDQVIQIYRALSQPQVLMYSATMSHDLEKMANSLANGVSVISAGKVNSPNKAVKQVAIWVESKQKKQKLFEILKPLPQFDQAATEESPISDAREPTPMKSAELPVAVAWPPDIRTPVWTCVAPYSSLNTASYLRCLCLWWCNGIEFLLFIYGGAPYQTQESKLRRGVDIVVGTPGRVKDHIERKNIDLSQLKFHVLDEANEMLRMGFVEDVELILSI